MKDINRPDRRSVLQSMAALGITGSGLVGTAGATSAFEPSDGNTVAFSELSKRGQRIFRNAVKTGSHSTEETLPDGLRTNLFVRRSGVVYELNRQYEYLRLNRIEPAEVPEEQVEDTASVPAYNGLSQAQRETFAAAMSAGRHTIKGNDVFTLSDEYVVKDGTYYRLDVTHMDKPVATLRPTQYE